jgi:hypothetical protein
LKYAQLTKKSLMVLDCQKDNRFGRDPDVVKNHVRSVLCVPFTDLISQTNGLIYADNTLKADAFSYHDFQEAEKFAKVLATQADLGQYEYKAPQKEELQIEPQPSSPWLPVAVAIASFLVLIPGVWTAMKPDPKPIETPKLTTTQNSGPEKIALSYLRALGGGGTEAAYQLLAPETKEKLSLEEFQIRAGKFLAGDQAFRLMRAEISSTDIGTTRAEIFVATASAKEPWKLTLIRLDGIWYIQSTRGVVSLKPKLTTSLDS